MSMDTTGLVISERYEIRRSLGRGSFGHTFLAHDRNADRAVAIKVLDARQAPDWKAFELFDREVAVMRGLRHPGVPEVFDAFRAPWGEGEAAFLVMEYVEGPTLADRIESGQPLDGLETTRLLLDLLAILDYLHGCAPPVLHRDIKPANIILRPGRGPALVDFGAVRSAFTTAGDSGSTVVGTFGYMPYEQYMGQATASSDLYALAATLLHLATGRPPGDFLGEEGGISVPDSLPDARLAGVLTRMLRPSPADRFPNAGEVVRALLATTNTPPARRSGSLRTRRAPVLPDLGPVPRKLEGEVKAAYDRIAPTTWRLMNSSDKPERVGFGDVVSVTLLSLVTVGVLPLVFWGTAVGRRRRLRRFFRDGLPAVARVLSVENESTESGEKRARVTYEFEADGHLWRDTDAILPADAVWLQPGEEVQILYMPDGNHDSAIVGV